MKNCLAMIKIAVSIIKVVGSIILVLFFVVGIPWIINLSYNCSNPIFVTKWGASDVLSFYGSLLGAAATIFVLWLTIKFTRDNQREERKLSIMPRLETELKHSSEIFENILDIISTIHFDAYVNVNFAVESCKSSTVVPKELEELIFINTCINRIKDKEEIEKRTTLFDAKRESYFNKTTLMQYDIYNYGANNAVEVAMYINDEMVYGPFCVSVDRPKSMLLIFDKDSIEGQEAFEFVLKYTDICSIECYKMRETFIVFKDENKVNIAQKVLEKFNCHK